MVSIPIGFFQALQPVVQNPLAIPSSEFQSLSGFFRPCNTRRVSIEAPTVRGFQSLSGFFRPCNRPPQLSGCATSCRFQSLSGFFRPCNTGLGSLSGAQSDVSIPIGFFQALQLSGGEPVEPLLCFNPYRVFSGLATAREMVGVDMAKCFNPYRVFSGLATMIPLRR